MDPYATEMLPPINIDNSRREPELLTHRVHDSGAAWQDPEAERRINALVSDGNGEPHAHAGATAAVAAGQRPLTQKQRRWRLARRALYAFVGLFIVFPILAFTITYFVVDIPSPYEIAAAQSKTVTYHYADGSVMARDSQDGNRVILKPEQIPDTVKHAVYAAEDKTFETNAGFDVMGIMRAVKNQLSGGAGGGSTITQQYVKKATENEELTITRKGTEIVKAFKMSNELSKSEIITAYLNTIYFGRGAYGIEAASQAYFKKSAEKLDASQAAFLAGIIQAPSRGDDPEYAERRWNYVMDQLVENKWLPAAERSEAKLPKVISAEQAKTGGFRGPKRHIKDRLTQELDKLGYTEDQVRLSGYKIYTTIDKRAQNLAEDIVRDVMKGEPKDLKEAMVAVDPETGGIRAYYGGEYDAKDQRDWAATKRNPGSTFKAFDFLALLMKGEKGPYAKYDGSYKRDFPGREKPVRNFNRGEGSCHTPCTVLDAMKRSVNTVFYDMVANDLGAMAVAEAATKAGVRSEMNNSDPDIAIGGGTIEVTPRDMASAYATFAAEGLRRDSHLVSKITTADGETVFQDKEKGKPAFDEDREKTKRIAGNVTMALEPVPAYSERACAAGRPCAGKTGTHQYAPPDGEVDKGDNSQAWMVGYSRDISVAAWVGSDRNLPIRDMNGSPIYGSGLPGAIWNRFMDAYHEGKPQRGFDEVKLMGEKPPPPPPPPTAEPEPTTKPDDEPSEPEEPPKTKTPPGRPTPPGDEDGGGEDGGEGGGGDEGGGDDLVPGGESEETTTKAPETDD